MSTSTPHQLTRLLDAPGLERVVPDLAPETLHQIIRHCGLEACGELIALATPAQLTSVFDQDLWRYAVPGQDDQFDSARFGEWLEALTGADPAMAARTVAALDENLVILGMSRFIRVSDPASAEPSSSSDDGHVETEAEPPSALTAKVGGYQVTALHSESWDAVVSLLVALEAGHRSRFDDVMRGCRRLSDSTPEDDGLDELLGAPEQMLHDVTSDREARRALQGYGTAADARAFLQMARQPRRAGVAPALPNPIAAAYFRAVDEGAATESVDALLPSPGRAPEADSDTHEALEAVAELLAAAGVKSAAPVALLESANAAEDKLAHIREVLERLSHTAPGVYLAATHELAFLTNMLVVGCSLQGRAFTADEASRAAVATCNLGLELGLPAGTANHDMVEAFGTGWAALHEQVAMFTVAQLIEVLAAVRSGDTRTHAGLVALRRALKVARTAGTPWTAREALDVLAILDVPTWTGLIGLIDECPTMAAAIEATLSGQTGSISATDFEFISTTRQITRTHVFAARLPHLLRD